MEVMEDWVWMYVKWPVASRCPFIYFFFSLFLWYSRPLVHALVLFQFPIYPQRLRDSEDALRKMKPMNYYLSMCVCLTLFCICICFIYTSWSLVIGRFHFRIFSSLLSNLSILEIWEDSTFFTDLNFSPPSALSLWNSPHMLYFSTEYALVAIVNLI